LLTTSYKSSVDAFRDLLSTEDVSSHKCKLSRVSKNISHLLNGLDYSFVEVTCDDGIQNGIQAYGDEATTLHKEALQNL
jgi:hypothetical protein